MGAHVPMQGFNPWSRKNPHARELLGPCPATTGRVHLGPTLGNKRSHCIGKPAHRNERKLACSIEDPAQPKINNPILKKDPFEWRASNFIDKSRKQMDISGFQ